MPFLSTETFIENVPFEFAFAEYVLVLITKYTIAFAVHVPKILVAPIFGFNMFGAAGITKMLLTILLKFPTLEIAQIFVPALKGFLIVIFHFPETVTALNLFLPIAIEIFVPNGAVPEISFDLSVTKFIFGGSGVTGTSVGLVVVTVVGEGVEGGVAVGESVGDNDGVGVGESVGDNVGVGVGESVGSGV